MSSCRILPRSLVLVVLCIQFISLGCGYRNGERIVYGQDPPVREIQDLEKSCAAIDLPEGSERLFTAIVSKPYSGVVDNEYSTPSNCDHINRFFDTYFLANGWKRTERDHTQMLFGRKTTTSYRSGNLPVSITCEDGKDIYGIQSFTVSCVWRK